MDYNELVQKRQEGVIDDLEFLLAQKDLAEIYLEDMKSRGENQGFFQSCSTSLIF